MKGDPVGSRLAAEELLWRIREIADGLGRRAAFYAVSPEFLPVYLDMGLSILKIGEVGRVPLAGFSLDGPGRKDFRYARGRAERDGYVFQVLDRDRVAEEYSQLQQISDRWLASKQGAEKGFALGAMSPGYLSNFPIAVLRHGPEGPVVAFANLLVGANRHELSLDLMRYDPEGPPIAMDALFASLLLWGQAEGFTWFSLGAAPLAGLSPHRLATTWNRLGNYLYEHGNHFYRFEGLRAFKEKFDPVWTPSYLAAPAGIQGPQVLYEVNRLISGSLVKLVR